jgi:23S rRNA (cytosine1962-C5)-methyltransferase
MQDFANRLKKNFKHIAKWAQRNGITCFRIYDHDMPEFPFCVDKYEDCAHIAAYWNKYKDEQLQEEQLAAAGLLVAEILNIDTAKVFVKQRRVLARREEQYEKVADQHQKMVVQENSLRFWVNLSDYLDTGLFLDHRPLRTKFLEEAKGKAVLNLFAYTGSFSVYARAAGAQSVTTVDLSQTYIQWAKDNFALNGYSTELDTFIQGDVMQFLKAPVSQQYDLVIVDPPSFSNSKRMKGTWDTQRDHATMLHLLIQHCNPGAVIYFSNNFRNFQPDFGRLKAKAATDITESTIPEDFRNKQIHKCYKIQCF